MSLLEQFLVEERAEIMRQDIVFSMIGRRPGLSDGVLREVDKSTRCSAANTGMRLCLAVNYGGRQELVDACRDIARLAMQGQIDPTQIDETTVSNHLYTSGMPDPDLLIRTAGEMRISNYLLWQISYAELWVTSTCWPEFRKPDLLAALRDFAARDRRFGGLKG
jgi:undecaprenyl diphosphate synthase